MDPAWKDEMFRWYYHEWMPGVTDTTYVNALYDAEIAYMDWQLRRIFAALEPIQDDTLVLITADHGEILDEQLGFYDHHGLYEGNIHVPLILYWPGRFPAGRRVPGFVQNVDFVPTFFDILGLPDTEQTEGRSLLPCIDGARDGNYEEVILSEATWEVKRGLVNAQWKFIHSLERDPHGRPLQELFDLTTDPTEQDNLAEKRPEIVQQLQGRLNAWVQMRLAQTGREADPVAVQGRCGTRIGTAIEGVTPGAGAKPRRLDPPREATALPASAVPDTTEQPAENRGEAATNVALDENTGTPLHGYVEKPAR
jgi:arylsulfatase A-like enzyme